MLVRKRQTPTLICSVLELPWVAMDHVFALTSGVLLLEAERQ